MNVFGGCLHLLFSTFISKGVAWTSLANTVVLLDVNSGDLRRLKNIKIDLFPLFTNSHCPYESGQPMK